MPPEVPPEGLEPPTPWAETRCSCPSSCDGVMVVMRALGGGRTHNLLIRNQVL